MARREACGFLRVAAASAVLSISAAKPGLCHHHTDPSALGHHWAMPIYLAEIHFQMALMGAAAVCIVAGRLYLRSRKRSVQ